MPPGFKSGFEDAQHVYSFNRLTALIGTTAVGWQGDMSLLLLSSINRLLSVAYQLIGGTLLHLLFQEVQAGLCGY